MDTFNPGSLQKLQVTRMAVPSSQALLRKLTHEPTRGRNSASSQKQIDLQRFTLERLSNQTAQDVIDSDTIMQMLPDLELAEQILVGSILSPKDMSSTDLSFQVAAGQFDSPLAASLLEYIKSYFKHTYKIDERLDLQLEQILTTKGAWISAVLPENNIDVIINGQPNISLEHLNTAVKRTQTNRPLGILGHPATGVTVSMEEYHGNLEEVSKIRNGEGFLSNITVTDNFNLLKQPLFNEKRRNLLIGQKLSKLTASMESASLNLTNEQIDQLYENKQGGNRHVHVITPQLYMDTPSVGHPLPLELPIEACMPVTVPGKPEEHVGYFILLDRHNRPVIKSDNRDYYNEMRTAFRSNGQNKDSTSEILRLTRQAMGVSDEGTGFEVEQIYQTYATIIENDLQNRLRNGIYGEEMDVGFSEEIQRIMLYRAFRKQQTQILYIPAELVTYVAFNYNKHGIGQTLLAKSKILSNMRSVLLFAETMAGVRNAVGRKKVNITVDPKDPDKQHTISSIQEMILETSRNAFPIGAPDPGQSLDYLSRAGYDFSIQSDGDGFGSTRVEFDDFNTNIQAGNQELQDRLRRMQVAGFGVPPEKVDPTASPDFAVGVVQNDLIMTRRVKRYQAIFCRGQTKFIRTYTSNSSLLMGELTKIVEDNRDKLGSEFKDYTSVEVAEKFVQSIEAKLPEPDTTRIDLMAQAFNQYTDLLNQAIEAYITPDLFPDESFPDASGAAERFKQILSAHFKRQYLSQNSILPELSVLHEIEDGKPVFNVLDMQESYMGTLGTAFHEFIKKEKERQAKWKETYPPSDDTPSDGFSTPGSDTSGDDAFTDDFSGDQPPADDMGLSDLDSIGDETPPGDMGGDELDEIGNTTPASTDMGGDELDELDTPPASTEPAAEEPANPAPTDEDEGEQPKP